MVPEMREEPDHEQEQLSRLEPEDQIRLDAFKAYAVNHPLLDEHAFMDGKSRAGHTTGRRKRWQIELAKTLATIGLSPC
jgi:hypothetical protein